MSSRPKVYLTGVPFETRIRSSLVKSGLQINYNIVVNALLVSCFPDVSPIYLADSYESFHIEFIRAVLRNNPLDLYIKQKRATDC